MIALLMPLVVSGISALAEQELPGQELVGPIPSTTNLPNSDKESDNSPRSSVNPQEAQEDKWALTDEDRMTDEEMDEELFGSEPDQSSLKPNEEKNSSGTKALTLDDKEEDESSPVKREPDRLAPQQTIESYLRNINSLTIDTFTPPATGLAGVDVPQRRLPPQQMRLATPASVSALQFQTPDIYHQPLYFEDQGFERYGMHRCRRQPFESARQFASDTVSMPREIRKQSPRSCVYRANPRYNHPSLIPVNGQ
jgi:hypothetical protein